MSKPQAPPLTTEQEKFLDRAYARILRTTNILEAIAAVVTLLWFGWKAALGAVLGGAVAYANLRWLHHGAEQVTQRMLAAPGKPARFRLSLAFFGRYLFVIVVGYVIFKSSAQALYGFLAALLVPVGAMMAEAAYQALAGPKTSSDA